MRKWFIWFAIWVVVIGCKDPDIGTTGDKISIDSTDIFQTWYTTEDQNVQFGFTIHESGYIEFLQWEMATGTLVNPFTDYDSIYFDFDSLHYKMKLNNCPGGWLAFYSVTSEWEYYVGNIVELTDSTLVLDAFIIDYSVFDHNIDFRKIDQGTFTQSARKSQFLADIRVRDPQNPDDTQKNYDYFFTNPTVNIDWRSSASWDADSKTLSLHMSHIDYPCVLGNEYESEITIDLSGVRDQGRYLLGDDQVSYTEYLFDSIWEFQTDTAFVEITSLDIRNQLISGRFGIFGRDSDGVRLAVTNGEFDFYLNEN